MLYIENTCSVSSFSSDSYISPEDMGHLVDLLLEQVATITVTHEFRVETF